MKTVTLIVPCFNEADVLPMLYKEVSRVISSLSFRYSFELLFVDDGSNDETLNIIKAIAERNTQVKYISFSRNFGKEAAMLAGMKNANSDFVGIIDADLQHSPDLIPEMLVAVDDEGYDVAAAKRSDRAGEAKIKSALSAQFYKVINKISETKIDDNAQDFRIMKKAVVDAIVSLEEKNRFSKGIFSWVGFNVKWFPHENRERAAGETKWSIRKLMRYALDGIMSFTVSPLRLSFIVAVVLGILSVILAFLGLVIPFNLPDYRIYMLLLGAIFFVTAIVCVLTGIVGEYLGRAYIEIKSRPVYIISETNIGKTIFDEI
ncbi:MAG TPA: glycosyltransferase family 2 protein [Clostridiales bacterium]|nr:glycosyltransferase family 2 protein [Clostridiales bacterium]